MNSQIGLFHLHFYTKYYKEYERFFTSELGLKIKGRFSKDEGLLDNEITWEEIEKNGIKLRLIELEKGAVNIVLMPGKFEEAKLEHFGFLLSEEMFQKAIRKAKELNLQVRENPHRTFISSKLGFRIEIHSVEDNEVGIPLDNFNELFIEDLVFSTDKPKEFKHLLNELFGVQVNGSEFRIEGSTMKLEEGKFELKSFKLGGKEYNKPPSQSYDLVRGLPIIF